LFPFPLGGARLKNVAFMGINNLSNIFPLCSKKAIQSLRL
jgi:hypothetical protein